MSDQDTSTQTPSGTSEEQANTSTGTTVPSAGFSQAAPLLMGVKLPIRVLLGRTQLCLRDIAQLGSGAVVELDYTFRGKGREHNPFNSMEVVV